MTEQELKRQFMIVSQNQNQIFEAIKKLKRKIDDIDYKLTYGTYKAGK